LYVLLLGDSLRDGKAERDDIALTIQLLHKRGFSEAGAWSKIIPCPNAAETLAQLQLTSLSDRHLSILTRYFTV
jgi:hypothetical protein